MSAPTPSHGRRNPFDHAGLDFRPVSPNLIKARLIGAAIPIGTVLVVGILALVFRQWVLGGIALAIATGLAVWLGWLIPRQVRAIGYAEAEDDLVIRKGILFRSIRVVPYGRMQFVDVNQGPLDRAFGMSGVKLFTAAATTDAELPGLPTEEAARLRDRLTERGEARLAGL
ncbi:MAG TPA: PH domain-containing protein [Actinomycetaceae bacterium]|nr:PH domain-containing protein [Actinomycetaceae bacterium]